MPNRHTAALLTLLGLYVGAASAAPTFDCAKAEKGSIEALVCQTPALGELDQQMDRVYKQALAKAANEHPPTLKAEQRGWIKGRDDCWKADAPLLCVRDSYRQRIAELQARYQLIEGKGPLQYVCDGQPAKAVIAIYYPTDPPTALVEFGDETSLMVQQQAGSGASYQGRNESLVEKHGVAQVTWGDGAAPMRCTLRQGQ